MKKFFAITAIVLACLVFFGCLGSANVTNNSPNKEPIIIVGQTETSTPDTTSSGTALVTASPAPSQAPTHAPTAPPTATPAATPTAEPTSTPEPDFTPDPIPVFSSEPNPVPQPDTDKGDELAQIALQQLNAPYVRGGKDIDSDGGFDPGGFVYYCLNKMGVNVSHKTSSGYGAYDKWPKIESMDDIAVGDLLFFKTGSNENINCVCIYLGEGRMIYPSSGEGCVITTRLSSDYWTSGFQFARRVFTD